MALQRASSARRSSRYACHLTVTCEPPEVTEAGAVRLRSRSDLVYWVAQQVEAGDII